MAVYTDKKTKRLYLEFQYKGERIKHRLPSGTTKRDAEKLEIEIKNQILRSTHGIEEPKRNITFEHFLKDYFGPYADAHYSADSWQKAGYVCKAAAPFLKGKILRAIKPADIDRFKVARMSLKTQHGTPRKPATVLRELAVLSKVFSLAVKNDLCDYNPCGRIDKPKFDNIQDKVLRREDEAAFFSKLSTSWAKDCCRFILHTGLSWNDVVGLSKFDVDRVERGIRTTRGKTKRRMLIPLNDVAMEIVERRWGTADVYLFASPKTGLPKGSVRHSMYRACEKAGIGTVTVRDLRRTYATRLEENDFDNATIAKMLGHSDLRTIHRYERSFAKMREASDSLAASPTIPSAVKDEVK